MSAATKTYEYSVRDRAGKFTGAFDAVLTDAGIEVLKIPSRSTGRMPTPRGSCLPPAPS